MRSLSELRDGTLQSRVVRTLVLSSLCLAVGVGCGGDDDPDAGAADRTGAPYQQELPWGTFTLNDQTAGKLDDGEELEIVMVSYNTSAPFWQPTREGIADASEQFGIEAQFVGPPTPSTEQQVAQIESSITRGVDGLIVVVPDADTLTPLIDRAIEAGIPVLTSNIDAPDSKRIAFVGQDLVKSGESAGEEFLKAFYDRYEEGDGPYKVIVTATDVAADYARDRIEGFKSVLEPTGDFEFTGPRTTGPDNSQVFSVVEDLFRSNRDAKGLFMADETIVGGGEYLERNDLTEDVIAVGYNFTPGTEQLMKSGAISASIGQFPYKQGYEPAKFLVDFLKHGKLPECAPVCDVGAEVANQENVDNFDFETTR